MEILRQPDSLSLLGNLKPFQVSSLEDVAFSLSVNQGGADILLLQEAYTPDSSGLITIDVEEVCRQYLKTQLPTDNAFLQEDALKTFTATVGATSISFTVVNSSVRNLALSVAEYLSYNFLTLQPQTKAVTWHSPEYLTYYFTTMADVKAKFYLLDGTTETVTVATISPVLEPGEVANDGTIRLVNKVYTVNTTLSRIMALSSHSTDELQGIVDVWVESQGTRTSYIQRYIYSPASGEEHYYLAVNSLGGIDTFTFIGERKISGEIEHQVADSNEEKVTVTSGGHRKYRQQTGYLGAEEAEWLWEFLHSGQQWVIANGSAEAISLVSSSMSKGDIATINSSTFDFILARNGGLLPEARRDESFPDITVPSPVSDLFFLNPRIIDFEAASEESELVFPVQTPYSNVWQYLTLSALAERLSLSAVPDHTHSNLAVLAQLGDLNGQLTYRGNLIGGSGGISLPISISDVTGLSTALNSKANTNHTHSYNDLTDKPHFVDFASEQTITGLKHLHYLDVLNSFSVPTSEPANPEAGKVYFWIDENGNSATAPSGGVASVYGLTITVNGSSWLSYDPGVQSQSVNLAIPTKVSDLQNDSGYLTSHQSLADYATKSWVQQQNYLTSHQSLTDYATKQWVEDKNYLTSHQSLADYATKSWVQQQNYLTSHQSLSGYATENWVTSQIGALNLDSMIEGIASNSARISSIEDRLKGDIPWRLSDLQNDLISAWALASVKPSYTWSEIGSRPTKLSQFTDDVVAGHYLPLTGGTLTGNLTGPLFTGSVSATGYLSVPTSEPANPEVGKVYFWIDENGNSATAPSGGVASVYGLTITVNGSSWLSYDPGVQSQSVNLAIPTKVSDLQNDSGYLTSHQSLADYATKSWVQQQNYLTSHQSLTDYATKQWVEDKNYLTSHQSLADYATKSWVQQQNYLTSHQSLSGYATENWVTSQIGALNLDSMIEGIASNSARISSIEDRLKGDIPWRLSDLQNDLISAWALASVKPSYTWSEIGSRPTKLSQFTDDVVAGHYLPLTGGTLTGNLTVNAALSATGKASLPTIDCSAAFAPPTSEPTNPETGKVYWWIDITGNSVN